MKEHLILGIDPGSHRAGFGLVSVEGDRVRHVHHGVIQLKSDAHLPDRLKALAAGLKALYLEYKIQTTAIEKIFFGKNASSAFVLGHARGICLLASAEAGVPVAEYAAKYVKKCVTGSGSASKEHVQMVVFNLLRVKALTTAFDASDALSLALTHARVEETSLRLKIAMERSP